MKCVIQFDSFALFQYDLYYAFDILPEKRSNKKERVRLICNIRKLLSHFEDISDAIREKCHDDDFRLSE